MMLDFASMNWKLVEVALPRNAGSKFSMDPLCAWHSIFINSQSNGYTSTLFTGGMTLFSAKLGPLAMKMVRIDLIWLSNAWLPFKVWFWVLKTKLSSQMATIGPRLLKPNWSRLKKLKKLQRCSYQFCHYFYSGVFLVPRLYNRHSYVVSSLGRCKVPLS